MDDIIVVNGDMMEPKFIQEGYAYIGEDEQWQCEPEDKDREEQRGVRWSDLGCIFRKQAYKDLFRNL